MTRSTLLLCLAGLVVSLFLATFLEPFSSALPDGLERVAQEAGFLEKAEGRQFWTHSPSPGYRLPRIANSHVATALAGVLGILVVFASAIGLGKVLTRRPGNRERRNRE